MFESYRVCNKQQAWLQYVNLKDRYMYMNDTSDQGYQKYNNSRIKVESFPEKVISNTIKMDEIQKKVFDH